MTIYDGKGRPGQGPRPHQVPLLAAASHALASARSSGEFAISTTGGKKPISVRTLGGWAHTIVGDSINIFQLKRIRSGVETLLAAGGVSREVRGHLQSHGLTGVQARHYDGHDYMNEKRAALEVLRSELTIDPKPEVAASQVVQGRRTSTSRRRYQKPRTAKRRSILPNAHG